ncbi:hypothetical protein TWF225_002121 [Orbilia oligospora]|uniref:Polysaccharide biosynthesis domain-containing protein n=1 Tax=Orbilia oligospora TaxID=2813651 RepID=A0A7C8PAC6_ORBOL|nr:hypothetical protein TWF751_009040 [Orbilia oligospora]KAF3190357.1 hypothetical protein TWF225_002121 [Orbilia oligospora]KAF3242767.1 hypothetical protein TWF217_011475 [Orbilia oligospora]KAF3258030.1 hypothetical protein TWF128_004926 [Orbilia oligospora]KAF3280032.1 hypothetical protein TWF132_011883 [Orbilia oligospora]
MSSVFNAETAENSEDIEKQFAVKAVMYMQTHWELLTRCRGTDLKLTKIDDEIYEHFKETFPDLDVSKKLDEDEMKSKEGKEKWRNFVNGYENKVKDFNFGTMLRTEPAAEYDQNTTIFCTLLSSKFIDVGDIELMILRRHSRSNAGKNDFPPTTAALRSYFRFEFPSFRLIFR